MNAPTSKALTPPPLVPSGRVVDMVEAFATIALQTSHDLTCPTYWGWFSLLLAELRKLEITPPDDAYRWWVELVRAVGREREVADMGARHDEVGVDWTARKTEALTALTGGAA